jgi:hypothetical protein
MQAIKSILSRKYLKYAFLKDFIFMMSGYASFSINVNEPMSMSSMLKKLLWKALTAITYQLFQLIYTCSLKILIQPYISDLTLEGSIKL